jgi:hypothetical protein
MKIKTLDPQLLKLYKYDPDTGVIFRTTQMGNYPSGSACNAVTTNGKYYKTTYKGTQILLHRLAWYLYYGYQPPDVIDHKDGNGLNNRIDNLREATTSTNQMNISTTVKSTTGIKGIMPVRGGTLFRAEVCVGGKRYQKHSKSIEKLKGWVTMKRQELHGEYAR